MTAGKKWYSLFVVTDDDAPGAPADGAEPRRASDLVPEIDAIYQRAGLPVRGEALTT